MLASHPTATGDGNGLLFGASALRLLPSVSRSEDVSSSASLVPYEPEYAELCYVVHVAIPQGLEFYLGRGVNILLVVAFVGVSLPVAMSGAVCRLTSTSETPLRRAAADAMQEQSLPERS
jgi:hypothetical protein